MKVDTKKVAQKLIAIAIAQSLAACREPRDHEHLERLTTQDRIELSRLLNEEIER